MAQSAPRQPSLERVVSGPKGGRLAQLQTLADASPAVQRLETLKPEADPQQPPRTQDKTNAANGRLPKVLQRNMENLSGISLDHVRVHRNSSAPSAVGAYAFAQGGDIHLGPGQEQHLPHEAWHVVQQAQGRVQPTLQAAGLDINDDAALEREATQMGARAASMTTGSEGNVDIRPPVSAVPIQQKPVVQRLAGMEIELRIPFYGDTHGVPTDDASFMSASAQSLVPWARTQVVNFLYGGLQYGVSYGNVAGHFDISADHTAWRQSHLALRRHIENRHIRSPGGPQSSMSNLEYRTTALEERGAASDATMRAIADEVRDHAVDSAGRATSGNSTSLPAPVAGQCTGIPVAALRALLAGDGVGLNLFNTMNNTLDPSLYYQTTEGALPSEIPDLFEEGAQDIDAQRGPNDPKAVLLRQAVTRANMALNAALLAPFVGAMEAGNREALLGWMTLVAEYLLAYQLEVSSYRYRIDGNGRLVKKSGINKNLVPYMSKTVLTASLNALPAAVRPTGAGPNAADWLNVMQALHYHCDSANFNLLTTLGLTDYTGQTHYDSVGTARGNVQHGELFGAINPGQWLFGLLHNTAAGQSHVRSGNELTLDAGQEHLAPELNIRGEQAIPLEDRASQYKASFGDPRDIAHANDRMMEIWKAAKDRRMLSTQLRANYQARHTELVDFFARFGGVLPLVPDLNALHGRFAPLAANPGDLNGAVAVLSPLLNDLRDWSAANSDAGVALNLLRPLINKANWSKQGSALIGKKTPKGVLLLRKELAAGNDAQTTLDNLGMIAFGRLSKGGSRAQVTANLYNLVYRAAQRIGSAPGWTNFANRYTSVNGAV